MQEAVPIGEGGMAAILGLTFEEVRDICTPFLDPNFYCGVANDNSPGQVVVSGHQNALNMVCQKAQEKGVKRMIRLPVSAPFHSPLMKKAAEQMKTLLSQTLINRPKWPIIMNVTARPLQPQESIADLLVQQMTSRVRFRESIEFLKYLEKPIFIEMVTGKVLTNLVKRMLPESTVLPFNKPED